MRFIIKGLILVLCFNSIIWARGFSPDIDDSLRNIPPKMRAEWLKSKGIDDSRYTIPFRPDSQNVRMVGKWGRGPSVEVTGKDSFVFVSLGSEVAVIMMTNSGNPQIITEIQASSLVYQSIIQDSFLYIGALGEIEIWNVSNPSAPVFRNRIQTVLNDIFVKDTFLYVISEDSFKIFNVRNISNPYLIGASRDSGNTIFVSNNYAYLGDRWGLYILNVSNPQNPYWVSTLSGGQNVDAIWVEDGHCYYTTSNNGLIIANVQNPNNPWQEGSLPSVGGYDIYKLSYFLYLPNFDIIDVSNPSFPTLISHLSFSGWAFGVWTKSPFSYAFIAGEWGGLQIMNIADPVYPILDTSLLGADEAEDIVIDNQKAYIADYTSMKIINVSNHSSPYEIGSLDTMNWRPWLFSVAVKDSFAYIGDLRWNNKLRTVDVSNPTEPINAGLINIANRPRDMVIKDTLLYIAEDYNFQIVSISHPRQLRLVGSCNLPTSSSGLFIKDTFAYISPRLQIINISNPANPILVSTTPSNSWGIFVRDTFAFISHAYDSLLVYSIANPLSPYEVGWASLNGQGYDVVVKGNFAYVGCYDLRVFDISNPANPILVGYYTTPDRVRRVYADSQYIYAACFAAGVCIFDHYSHGIEESNSKNIFGVCNLIYPNPTSTKCYLNISSTCNNQISIHIYNITGQKLKSFVFKTPDQTKNYKQEVSLSDLPDGVLFFQVRQGINIHLFKVMKVIGR